MVRGGGLGFNESWTVEGRQDKKQNGIDDFIAAAEYLIGEGITNPSKLAVEGQSSGALLVAAASNQRPELFAAATPHQGGFDMLRHPKLGHSFQCQEFGCSDNKAQFENLLKYSPIRNIRGNVTYPAILVTAQREWDQLAFPPVHSYKYIAELQHMVGRWSGNKIQPILLRGLDLINTSRRIISKLG